MTDPLHRILVVDDDPMVRDVVRETLERSGFGVVDVGSAEEAQTVFAEGGISLMIVDLGLPGIDGLTLTRDTKAASDVGIIILSGRGDAMERVIGLEVGADDYIGKPFEPRELVARVRSVLRRTVAAAQQAASSAPNHVYVFANWTLDGNKRSLQSPDGDFVSLSTSEYDLLLAFANHPNTVLSRDQLMDLIHTNDAPAFDRSIDIRVARLRKKIEANPSSPEFIKTIRNGGYIFTPPVEQR